MPITRNKTPGDYNCTFLYDALGRFEKIQHFEGVIEFFQYVYDAASNEKERKNLLTGVDQIYTRDELNRMTRRDVKKGTMLSSEIYGFDVMNRLTSTERIENGEDKLDTFGYDFSSQLTAAQYGFQKVNNVWVNPIRPVSYTWDKAGNRDHVVDTGSTTNYTTTNLNQYIAAGADAVYNGSEHEISNYQGKNYGYVNDERLASIASANDTYQLAYDALGRCVKRTLNGVITYYVYDGEKPILEYNSVYQRVGAHIYGKGIDEILSGVDYTVSPSVPYWCQHDHEGSVTHLTDANGTVIESYRYDAFGAPKIFNSTSQPINSSTFGNRFMFTGREYAQKFGVYEYRNRAYHPGLGRFTSEDPMGFAAGDNNLFRYCGNDPVDRVDPDGTIDSWTFCKAGYDRSYEDFRDEAAKQAEARNRGSGDPAGNSGSNSIAQGANANAGGEKKGVTERVREFIKSPEFEQAAMMSTPAGRGAGLLSRIPWIARLLGRGGIKTVDDVLRNPTLLRGKSPAEIREVLANTPGWRVEALGRGTHKGEGLVLRQYTAEGNQTGRVIQWHPGGGHHGSTPYWKVRSGEGGISGEIPGGW